MTVSDISITCERLKCALDEEIRTTYLFVPSMHMAIQKGLDIRI